MVYLWLIMVNIHRSIVDAPFLDIMCYTIPTGVHLCLLLIYPLSTVIFVEQQ